MKKIMKPTFIRKKYYNPRGSNINSEKKESEAATVPEAGAIGGGNEEEYKDTEVDETLPQHPLQNKWTLWYLESNRAAWEGLLNEVATFDTVEDFWSLYSHIKPPSELKVGNDYILFKKGIPPNWEDSANVLGGRWIISLSRAHIPSHMDNLWLDVLLCLINEAFDHSEQICGAVINIPAKYRKISVWTSDSNNEEAILEIGQKLQDSLGLPKSTLEYHVHKNAMVTPRYTL